MLPAMASAPAEWSVLPHKPIEKLAENLWRVEGSLPGMPLERQMVVVRMTDGRLLLHSPIALEESGMKELEAWGPVAFIVVPGGFHRLDGARFRARYPAAKVLVPRGARAKVARKVAVDGTYEELPADPSVRFEALGGIGDVEGALVVRSADGTTVVLNDAVFNLPAKPPGLLGWLITTAFGSAPGPRVSRLFRHSAVESARELAASLERLAALPDLARVIVAHGVVASGPAAAETLRAAARTC